MAECFATIPHPANFRFHRYSANMQDDLLALWKARAKERDSQKRCVTARRSFPSQVWVPATLFNFSFSPMWMRIPVVASTSLLWTCILSSMRGAADVPVEVRLRYHAQGGGGGHHAP